MGPALQGIFVGRGPRALPGVRGKTGRRGEGTPPYGVRGKECLRGIPQSASLTAPFTQGGLKSVLGFCFAVGLGSRLSAAVVIAAGLIRALGLVPGGGGAHRRLFTARSVRVFRRVPDARLFRRARGARHSRRRASGGGSGCFSSRRRASPRSAARRTRCTRPPRSSTA